MIKKKVIHMRYFFFSYSFWTEKKDGRGNLSLTSSEFPSAEKITERAKEKVSDRYFEHASKIYIVVDGWIEMSEADFKAWTS